MCVVLLMVGLLRLMLMLRWVELRSLIVVLWHHAARGECASISGRETDDCMGGIIGT
jgi:hypothetical protein